MGDDHLPSVRLGCVLEFEPPGSPEERATVAVIVPPVHRRSK
jgi:hypothetical protein